MSGKEGNELPLSAYKIIAHIDSPIEPQTNKTNKKKLVWFLDTKSVINNKVCSTNLYQSIRNCNYR